MILGAKNFPALSSNQESPFKESKSIVCLKKFKKARKRPDPGLPKQLLYR
jgi:hypothetical protein